MEQPTSVDNGLQPEPARNRRKHSATAAALERRQHDHVDIVDGAEILDEADRRLAELGYVAVGYVRTLPTSILTLLTL